LAAQAFSRAYRSNPDIEEVLQQLLPAKPRVYVDVISQLALNKQLGAAQMVWKALIALHPKLEIANVHQLVLPLLQARDYSAASRVWDEGVATMNLPPLLHTPGSVVWDSSFESGVRGAALAWRFEPMEQSVSVGLDEAQKLTGRQSLRLAFDGKHNPNLDAACILVIVQPDTTYRFTGWIKTNNITTENGIEFRVYSPDDPKTVPLKTRELHGTVPWTLVEGTWSAVDTHQAQVCVTREASDNPQIRISGMAWVDGIDLVPLTSEQRN
jgi:hypothetical protein